MLNSSGESGHPCLVPDFRGNAFNFSPMRIMFSVGLTYMAFIMYFLSEQCKEIEENNKMGKTRDLFKKIRYQGNISCKVGHNKGQKWYGPKRSRRY